MNTGKQKPQLYQSLLNFLSAVFIIGLGLAALAFIASIISPDETSESDQDFRSFGTNSQRKSFHELKKHIEILSSRVYRDEDDWVHVTGQLQNHWTKPIQFIQVQARFYDATRTFVGSGWTYCEPHTLLPEEKGTFEVTVIEPQICKHVRRYAVSIVSGKE